MMMRRFNKIYFLGIFLLLASFVSVPTAVASPIHEAALAGDVELVKLLIENGADVDDRDVQGYTPLLLAIQAGHTDIAKVLIANGADVNARSASDGGDYVTPLDLSIILDRRAVGSYLRDHGAIGARRPAHSSPPNPGQ
jgi:ankyrin repeat protein